MVDLASRYEYYGFEKIKCIPLAILTLKPDSLNLFRQGYYEPLEHYPFK